MNFKALASTQHWYIRLIQWPVVLVAYPLLFTAVFVALMFVALTWPFHDWESK